MATRKDFQSDQEVRWCPGCGDYSILAQVQRVLRAEYLVDAAGFNRVRGLPLASDEILDAINQLLGSPA